jgi:outer membrane protein OmpA-like peptidoglycan-associated protein
MIKTLINVLLVFCVLQGATAQKLSTKSKKAQGFYMEAGKLFVDNNYGEAVILLKQAIKKDKKFKEAYFLLADIYYSQKDYENELNVLNQAIDLDSTFFLTAYYNLGVASFYLGDRENTIYWMKKYKKKTEGKRSRLDADRWILQAKFAEEAINKPVNFEPVNLGISVNSDYDEYWPSITADEESMVFTVLVPKDSTKFKTEKLPKTAQYFGEDFFTSEKCGEEWSLRRSVNSLNTDGNEGAQCLSADGAWMFFTACGKKGSVGSCDIYFSYKTLEGWSVPANLGPPVNTPYWESQPSFSSDGRTLYFVSNRRGGKGNKDIWKATLIGFKPDKTPVFSTVVNMGDEINTSGDEISPFIHHDNYSLYFSSDEWPGMGNMDLFICRRDSIGKWGMPENLGYPINTLHDEIGLVINAKGTTAYFSSDGLPSKTKGKDLYMFKMPERHMPYPVTYVKGKVYDRETGEKLEASFILKNIETDKQVVSSWSDTYSGSFLVCLPVGNSYALSVQKPGYLFYSESFDLEGVNDVENPQQLMVYLSPIKPGEKTVLKNIFFDSDSYELKKESFAELNTLVEMLVNNSGLKVEIGGHTDNVGSEEYNLSLSKNRAKSVRDYLVQQNIKAESLSYRGYGFSEPIADNSTDKGRAQNRRTEIKVLP